MLGRVREKETELEDRDVLEMMRSVFVLGLMCSRDDDDELRDV